MKLLFDIKCALMLSMMERRRKEPFSYTEADLFEIPAGAGPLINNSWFFGGDSPDGTSFKMRLAFRNNAEAEVFLIWICPDGRYFVTEKQSYAPSECPIRVKNVIPGRDWDVWFDGQVSDMADGSRHHCSLSFRYTARLPIFYPMLDGSLWGMAQAFATQKWNRGFFKSLAGDTGMGTVDKSIRQVHYEQTGRMEGTVSFDGADSVHFSVPGIRDRAFGKRDWNYMDCHMWLVAVTERGEVMNLSIVSYPNAKRLFCGYTDMLSDRNAALTDYRIVSYDHCGGKGPESFEVDLRFSDGRCYRMTARRTHDLVTPFDGGNFYFHEGVGDFIFRQIPALGQAPAPDALTISAHGSIELGWNRDSSRWETYER